jgi:hypothetical protein
MLRDWKKLSICTIQPLRKGNRDKGGKMEGRIEENNENRRSLKAKA